MLRFASLGSGSEGNALIVEVGETRVMLDCGFGIAETEMRLARLELLPTDITAIIVTHEHSDHIGGVARFANKHRIPVHLTYGTLASQRDGFLDDTLLNEIDSHTPFSLDDIEIFPFPVPHDAREPAQFLFGDGAVRLGVLTDVGTTTPHIESMLSGLEGLVLETNHDLEQLRRGRYPPSLKERISGPFGHLDNDTSAATLSRLDRSRLQHLVAAHLSVQNNSPEQARAALASVMGCDLDWIRCADQQTGFGWLSIA